MVTLVMNLQPIFWYFMSVKILVELRFLSIFLSKCQVGPPDFFSVKPTYCVLSFGSSSSKRS